MNRIALSVFFMFLSFLTNHFLTNTRRRKFMNRLKIGIRCTCCWRVGAGINFGNHLLSAKRGGEVGVEQIKGASQPCDLGKEFGSFHLSGKRLSNGLCFGKKMGEESPTNWSQISETFICIA